MRFNAIDHLEARVLTEKALEHISRFRIPQSQSGESHRNARNPMKTNVKTHVNMCTSMESKKILKFLGKKPCKNGEIIRNIPGVFLDLSENSMDKV